MQKELVISPKQANLLRDAVGRYNAAQAVVADRKKDVGLVFSAITLATEEVCSYVNLHGNILVVEVPDPPEEEAEVQLAIDFS
jgi:hypothetical protein